MNKQISFFKRLVLISISLIAMMSSANENKKDTKSTTKTSKYQNINLSNIPAKLFRDIEIADTTSYLFYDKAWIEETPKPNLKMYSNKEFKGDPTAELNDTGFYFHGKLICKYLYDWEVPTRRILHDAKDADNACEDIGPLDSFIDGDAGTYIYIYVKDATDSYYEVKFKKEKFYISVKETKGFRYIESRLKQVARLHNRYKDLIKNDETFRNFINKTSECIKKEDLKCLSGDNDQSLRIMTRNWLENVCNPEVINNDSIYCKKLNDDGVEYYESARLDNGKILKLFWNHIKSCKFNDLENILPVGGSDEEFYFLNKDKSINKEKGQGGCKILFLKATNKWEIMLLLYEDISNS